MKNSNQRSEEWRSAVSSQQSARERGRDREIAPTRRAVSRRFHVDSAKEVAIGRSPQNRTSYSQQFGWF